MRNVYPVFFTKTNDNILVEVPDLAILTEGKDIDGRYSNFIKGNEYRCMLKGGGAVLIDEDKMGYSTDMETFEEDFEIIK